MKNMSNLSSVLLIVLAVACASPDQDLEQAKATITTEDLAADIKILASDEFEGRAPSSAGEEKTISFLQQEFDKLGLAPGNGESYFQEVPLVAITANPEAELVVKSDAHSLSFAYGDEFMAWTKQVVGRAVINTSEMVFCGYGIIAPEYEWNDYEGLDVRGKTVVLLVNDPGFATQNDSLFNGNAMTYYGRWTYKFEQAARQGAAAAFIIHDTEPAGYPWEVVAGSWSGRQFDLVSDDNNMSRCAVEGWLTLETAKKVFERAGQDLQELQTAATQKGFKAVSLGMTASLTLENDIEHSRSNNVIAMLPGETRAEETVFYMAHWDHFGRDESREGDQIFNGAFDNATGTAGLLELAEAFTSLQKQPARSVVFLAVTAEEQGLLGSEYYATHPIFPREKTVAAINMDGLNVYGKMKDITVIGYGNSELDDYVQAAAKKQGRTVRPDPEPEKGHFYRSDHFSFAKQGIPALYTDEGIDHVEHGEAWTLEQKEKYVAERYHKPTDEYDPNWDLSGAIDDLHLLFEVGYRLSTTSAFPNWREGNEFRAKRDAEQAASQQSKK
ncbi:MAG: M28 family metallopeptidase [bacterium]